MVDSRWPTSSPSLVLSRSRRANRCSLHISGAGGSVHSPPTTWAIKHKIYPHMSTAYDCIRVHCMCSKCVCCYAAGFEVKSSFIRHMCSACGCIRVHCICLKCVCRYAVGFEMRSSFIRHLWLSSVQTLIPSYTDRVPSRLCRSFKLA